ncbi:hypothetical protein [Bartonella sp. CL100XZDX]
MNGIMEKSLAKWISPSLKSHKGKACTIILFAPHVMTAFGS